jgi:hypothetical protein
LRPCCRRCSFGPACPEKWQEPKPRSPASAGCDAIANAATTAASTTILHIASLPDRASGAARDVPHRARRKSELRGPLWDSVRIGWSVGHALVHLPLLKAVEVEPTQQANVPQVKADGTADWLARRVDHTSNSKAILKATIRDSTGLKHRTCISCRSAELEGFEDCCFSDVRGWSWFWSCRHSRAPHLARALSSGLRSEALRSPFSTLVERLVGSGRKRGHRGPGQRREKNRPGDLAGRRASCRCYEGCSAEAWG